KIRLTHCRRGCTQSRPRIGHEQPMGQTLLDCWDHRRLPSRGLKIAAGSVDDEVKRKGSIWPRVQRKAVAPPGMMPSRPSVFRPNCVKVWTPGQLNKATNRHGPKRSFGLTSWGLKRLVEGSRLRTEPRKHPKWRPRR